MKKYDFQAKQALSYLLKTPKEKRVYLAGKGSSKQEFWDSFKPEPLDSEEISRTQVCRALEITHGKFSKLEEKGYFGKTKKEPSKEGKGGTRKYVNAHRIEEILTEFAYMIPVSLFHNLLRENQWYFNRGSFDKKFRDYFENPINKKRQYVHLKNAAKIVGKLKKRKNMVENWHTLNDLNKDSGLNLPFQRMNYRYREMQKRREIRLTKVNIYGGRSIAGFGGWEYKLCPYEYNRMLEVERKNADALENGVTTAEIAKQLGISVTNVGMYIKVGKELGILHPFDVISFPGRGNSRHVLPKDEVRLWVRGKLNIPSRQKYNKLKKTLSLKKINELLIKESRGFSSAKIAERMNRGRATIGGIIKIGNELGLLHPISHRYKGSGRPFEYILSKKEAKALISGKLKIPSKTRMVKLEEDLEHSEIIEALEIEKKGRLEIRDISKIMKISISKARHLVQVAVNLGFINSQYATYSRAERNRYIFSEADTILLANRTLKIPSYVRFANLRRDLSDLEIRGLIKRVSQGVSSTEIAEKMGINSKGMWRRIRAGEQVGALHPVSHRYEESGRVPKYVLSKEEARALINRDIIIPSFCTARKLEKIAIESGTPIRDLFLEKVYSINKVDLWEAAKQGDSIAFNFLLEVFSLIIKDIATKYRPGTTQREKEEFLQTSLFEVLYETNPFASREEISQLLKEGLRKRVEDERPSWLSVDRGPIGETQFKNIFEENKRISLRE